SSQPVIYVPPKMGPSRPAPIFFRLALHRRSRRVLHLEPITRAPRAVERVLALRHDAFEPHLARMGEDCRAVALDVLVEAQAKASFGQHKRGLARFQGITPHVVAIQLDQVEGVEEGITVMASDTVERGNAVVVASDSFTVDHAGARAQPGERINDQREATSEVVGRTAVEPHPLAVLAGNDAEAVVLAGLFS